VELGLTGARAVVTGGSRGIGKAIARGLAREGADVAIVARDPAALEATARELAAETGRTIVPIACDTSSDQQVRAMAAEAAARLGGVDVLVNCAAQPGGQQPVPSLAQITDDAFWSDVNVKVMGYLRCIRELAPHLAAGGGGRVVNVSGLAARSTGSTIGSIRNVAVSALTKTLADELAPQGIRLVTVHPGATRTEQTPAVLAARAAAAGVSEEEAERQLGAHNLLGRMLDAGEVADVVVFLASPRAVAVNGDVVAAGGGVRGPIHY
jgi:NAD(P)-dependent dehydrogenase (short-subunit alcohol dehydrogenase family)